MRLRDRLRALRSPLGPSFRHGNSAELLVDGGPYFRALLELIAGARRSILIETYILVADKTGWRVAEALIERARAGVEVALMYDGLGSSGLTSAFVSALREAGVKLVEFRPVFLLRGRTPWTKRNHRKVVVVDGEVGIVGGMNISDDYAAIEDGGRGWHDLAVRIRGPAVEQLDALFRWVWMRENGPALVAREVGEAPHVGRERVRFLSNNAIQSHAQIRREYLYAIRHARRSVRIIVAYFSPDRRMLAAIRNAARRGVRVELILAGTTDVRSMLYVARGLYGYLLSGGVRIFEWHDRVLHAKGAVVDGHWSTVGSANLTYRAWLMELEVNASILGRRFGAEMTASFERDLARCKEITREEWARRPLLERVLAWFFGLFRRLA